MAKESKKTCKACGKPFSTKANRTTYCSWACKVGTHECQTCKKQFVPKARNHSGKFCSLACWYAWDGRVEPKECPACRTMFRPDYPSQTYCGFECKVAASRQVERNTVCQRCGGYIKATKNSKSIYCSRKCASLTRAENDLEMHGFTAPDGHKTVRRSGYVHIKVNGRWTQNHRHIMESKLGRPLLPVETVHHVNGDKTDNRPENLELWSKSHHPGQRVEDIVKWAVEVLKIYRPDLLK